MLYYHNPNHAPHEVPKNLPVVDLNDDLTGKGWVKVPVGVLVKTWYQAYRFQPKPGWHLSAYFTNEEYRNGGFSNYRRPSSLKAWLIVLSQLPKKYWRRWRGEL